MNTWDPTDQELLDELADALRTIPDVPVLRDAKALFTWRTIDEDLANLAFDSAIDCDASPVRDSSPASAVLRTLTFETDTLTIEVGVHAQGILGQLVPPQPGTVEVQTEDATLTTVPVDDLGCFTLTPVPRIPFRLHLQTAAGSRAITPWLRV